VSNTGAYGGHGGETLAAGARQPDQSADRARYPRPTSTGRARTRSVRYIRTGFESHPLRQYLRLHKVLRVIGEAALPLAPPFTVQPLAFIGPDAALARQSFRRRRERLCLTP